MRYYPYPRAIFVGISGPLGGVRLLFEYVRTTFEQCESCNLISSVSISNFNLSKSERFIMDARTLPRWNEISLGILAALIPNHWCNMDSPVPRTFFKHYSCVNRFAKSRKSGPKDHSRFSID